MPDPRLAAWRAAAEAERERRDTWHVRYKDKPLWDASSLKTVVALLDLVDRLEAENQQLRDELADGRNAKQCPRCGNWKGV